MFAKDWNPNSLFGFVILMIFWAGEIVFEIFWTGEIGVKRSFRIWAPAAIAFLPLRSSVCIIKLFLESFLLWDEFFLNTIVLEDLKLRDRESFDLLSFKFE